MTKISLNKELQALDTQIIELGTLSDDALEKALAALETRDYAKAGLIIAADHRIDTLRKAIEEHAIRLLAWPEPLKERDLRYLMSALMIVSDLERIGDGAAGIAKMLLRMTFSDPKNGTFSSDPLDTRGYVSEVSILQSILDLGKEARRVLQGTLLAFAERDVNTARYLWQEDDVVDVRYHGVRHDLMNMLAGTQAITALHNDADILLRATYLLWIAHKLERVADHCTNICERIVFMIEGETTIIQSYE
jgi:phosphate transport system protein